MVNYEDGWYTLIDNDTGESSIGKSFEKAIDVLVEKINEYKKKPEQAEIEDRKKAGKMIDDMCRDQFFMSSVLVGMVSAECNRTESEIKKNLRHFRWLQNGLKYASPKNEKQKPSLKEIEEYIVKGIEILERDEVGVPGRDRLEALLGMEACYQMRKLYNSYFDPITVSTDSRDRYISEKFGDCEEPTYDYLWNVWYLGEKNRSGKIEYTVGSAIEVLGRFLDCRVASVAKTVDSLGITSVKTGGTIESLFQEAWIERNKEYHIELEEKDFLSKRQKELWDKVVEYAQAH